MSFSIIPSLLTYLGDYSISGMSASEILLWNSRKSLHLNNISPTENYFFAKFAMNNYIINYSSARFV